MNGGPGFLEWLVVQAGSAFMRVSAALGDETAQKLNTEYDARRAQLKVMDKVHKYAMANNITHREAARRIGVSVSEDVLEQFASYDPVEGDMYKP